MLIIACDKCKARYDLPESEAAATGSVAIACGFCGEPIVPAADAPVENEQVDLLDELLAMSPAIPHAARSRELTTRASPPPPPLPIEVIAVRSTEEVTRNGGRQVPLESGVLNVTALEPETVEVLSPPLVPSKPPVPPKPPAAAEPEAEMGLAPPPASPPPVARKVANGRPSNALPPWLPGGAQAVSALPPVVTVPPRGLVQTYVELPVMPARHIRDSLDDGWDATSPAPPTAAAAPAVAQVVPLPAVRLPWEILTEDTLAADGETVPLATIPIDPSKLAPVASLQGEATDDDEWANVPDDSLADDDDPDTAVGDALHDAVTGEPSDVSSINGVLNGATVAAAVPPAWMASASPTARLESHTGSSSVSPVVNSASAGAPPSKSLARRLAPAIGGVVVLGVVVGFFGLRGGSDGSRHETSDTSVAAARPAVPAGNARRDESVALNPALAAALAPKNEPTRAPAPGPSASAVKSTFNSKAANTAVARAISRARGCKKAGQPAVNAEAAVTFATTGRVTAVNVTGHKVGGTPLATCIASTLKTAKIPPFTGEASTIKKAVKYR